MESSYWFYILYSSSLDRYYVGSTGNISDRLKRHNAGRSRYTRAGLPWELIHSEKFETRSAAYRRERYVKSQKSRPFLEKLIKGS